MSDGHAFRHTYHPKSENHPEGSRIRPLGMSVGPRLDQDFHERDDTVWDNRNERQTEQQVADMLRHSTVYTGNENRYVTNPLARTFAGLGVQTSGENEAASPGAAPYVRGGLRATMPAGRLTGDPEFNFNLTELGVSAKPNAANGNAGQYSPDIGGRFRGRDRETVSDSDLPVSDVRVPHRKPKKYIKKKRERHRGNRRKKTKRSRHEDYHTYSDTDTVFSRQVSVYHTVIDRG